MTSRWDGATYASVAELQRTLALAEVAAIAWRGDERVLDVGCGDGAVTAQLAQRVPRGQVLGVDSSPAQVAYANAQHGSDRLRFEVQDAVSVRVEAPCDVVTSFNALHWVADLTGALAGIATATRPGGLLVIRVVAHVERTSLEAVIREVCGAPRWVESFSGAGNPVRHLSRDSWVEHVEAAGFGAVGAEVEDRTWDFGSRAAFADWLRANAGAWSHRLAPEDVDAFVDDVLTAYLPVGGGEGVFRFYQLRLRAIRR